MKTTLTAEQTEIIAFSLQNPNTTLLVDGVAGSGKTTVLANLRIELEKRGHTCLTLTHSDAGLKRFSDCFQRELGSQQQYNTSYLAHTYTLESAALKSMLAGEFSSWQNQTHRFYDSARQLALIEAAVDAANIHLEARNLETLNKSSGQLVAYQQELTYLKFSRVFTGHPFDEILGNTFAEAALDEDEDDNHIESQLQAALHALKLDMWKWQLYRAAVMLVRNFHTLLHADSLMLVGSDDIQRWLRIKVGTKPILLIDELQDASPLHLQFMLAVRQHCSGMIAVGDRCQHINEWLLGQFLAINPYHQIPKQIPNTEHRVLSYSHRFGYAIAKYTKKQRIACQQGQKKEVLESNPDHPDQVIYLANDEKLLQNLKIYLKAGSTALLLPDSIDTVSYLKQLTQAKIPYYIKGGKNWGLHTEGLLLRGLFLLWDYRQGVKDYTWLDAHALVALSACHQSLSLTEKDQAALVDKDYRTSIYPLDFMIPELISRLPIQFTQAATMSNWVQDLSNFLRLTAYLALLSSSERTIKKSITLFQSEMLEALAQPNWRQHNAQQIKPIIQSKKSTLGVIRVYDAKGHEFNTVLLPPIWQEAWVTPEQRYVAASRAKSLLVISKATQ